MAIWQSVSKSSALPFMFDRFSLFLLHFFQLLILTYAVDPSSWLIELENRPSGLSFTRTIDDIPGSFDLVFDGHPCTTQDEHGDNDCHFDWGTSITGWYKLFVDRAIDVGDRMTGHFKVSSVWRPSAVHDSDMDDDTHWWKIRFQPAWTKSMH